MRSTFKDYLQYFIELIRRYSLKYFVDFLPSLILIYIFIPTINKDFGSIHYIIAILFILNLFFLYYDTTNKKRWIYSFIILVILLMIQGVKPIFLYFMFLIFLMYLFKVRNTHKIISYFIDMLIFLFILFVITSILIQIPGISDYEEMIIAAILIIMSLYLAVYTIRISFDTIKYLSSILAGNVNNSLDEFIKKHIPSFIVISILFLLLLPDTAYAWFMHDFYFSLSEKFESNVFDAFFYTLSLHFNITIDVNHINEMNYLLLSTKSGNFIKIIHTILLKLIETIVLGAIVGMFVEYLKDYTTKRKKSNSK